MITRVDNSAVQTTTPLMLTIRGVVSKVGIPFLALLLILFGNNLAIAKEATSKNISEALLAEGLSYMQNGDYPSAIKKLEEALRSEPENARIIYQLGMAHYNLDHIDQAQSLWKKAAAKLPSGSKMAKILLAIIDRAEERKTLLQKKAKLEGLLKEKPDLLDQGLELATLYRKNRQDKEAGLLYKQISKFHPTSPHPYVGIAELAEKEGRILWAQKYYQMAFSHDSSSSKVKQKLDEIENLLERLRTVGLGGVH